MWSFWQWRGSRIRSPRFTKGNIICRNGYGVPPLFYTHRARRGMPSPTRPSRTARMRPDADTKNTDDMLPSSSYAPNLDSFALVESVQWCRPTDLERIAELTIAPSIIGQRSGTTFTALSSSCEADTLGRCAKFREQRAPRRYGRRNSATFKRGNILRHLASSFVRDRGQ